MVSYSVRDRSLIQAMDRAARDLEQMKQLQRIGSTNLATHVSESTLITSEPFYDPASGILVGENMYVAIEFTATNQSSPFGRLALDLRYGTPTTPATEGQIGIFGYLFTPTSVGDRKLRWEVDLRSGVVGVKFYAIFKVAASDYGSVHVGSL